MLARFSMALVLVSGFAYADNNDPENFIKQYNEIFDGQQSVCNSVKADSDAGQGYHIAEVTKLDGKKEVLRVPQNVLGKLKKVGDTYVADFYSYRWDAKSGKSRTEVSYLKLEKNSDGTPRFNMYDKNQNLQGEHAINTLEDGSVEFIAGDSAIIQTSDGLENANKDALFYLYAIRAKKEANVISYSVDDIDYVIPADVREKVEKDLNKKFFTDKLNPNGTAYVGNSFSVEEIKKIAEKYNIKPKNGGAKPWTNCPPPTEEELLAYNKKNLKEILSKKGNNKSGTLKNADRNPHVIKEKDSESKNSVLKESSKQ